MHVLEKPVFAVTRIANPFLEQVMPYSKVGNAYFEIAKAYFERAFPFFKLLPTCLEITIGSIHKVIPISYIANALSEKVVGF